MAPPRARRRRPPVPPRGPPRPRSRPAHDPAPRAARRARAGGCAHADALPRRRVPRDRHRAGRVAGWGGGGPPRVTGGRPFTVDRNPLRKTATPRLFTAGLAYPTFYSKLYVDLRRELAKRAGAARGAGKGVFARDRTQKGVE